MKFEEAKNKYIQTWGALGSQWGINKTMAQIHALLMIYSEALSIEEIMSELQISRGNASMNIRALIDWGIVFKETKSGERKEFFTAEKDPDRLAVTIAKERSRRELKPAIRMLKEVSEFDANDSSQEQLFMQQTTKLYDFVNKADNMVEKVAQYQKNWLSKLILKLLK
ncbi:GbsR/MarR family transcriptional regulator [Flammeovirga aprica]|uniref:HTH-type transcriptional regulator n=1 Tax=Flammeovirga aprica JL-4 TaxID=694437 RepID=A0A7X9P263_9BACT|nr:MarR family transcriptional regulator [Flammeovirga aprica]NME68050.1 transcriptional regulator [Flammeovirga aprica JL-4]